MKSEGCVAAEQVQRYETQLTDINKERSANFKENDNRI